jgi:hypothetical protein
MASRVPIINANSFILCDDEDFAEVSKYQWRLYFPKRRKAVGIVKAYILGVHRYIYPSEVLFPHMQGNGYRWVFKDGDCLNWQRKNLLIYSGKTGMSIDANSSLSIDWCPLGPAMLLPDSRFPGEVQRSKECTKCDDSHEGPYWRCLALVRKTSWPGWRREDDKR